MINTNTRNRIQAISIDGSVADKYFEVTSEVPRNTVAARINATPRNGRSERAGAIWIGFCSGSGDRALSSFKAAAAGRVTVLNSGVNQSNRARPQGSAITPQRQGPKTGSGYALAASTQIFD